MRYGRGAEEYAYFITVKKIITIKLCSTPFGIKDPFTNSTTRSSFVVRSAQRLSASKILSPPPVDQKFAIKPVLNAFRHQRSFHPEPQVRQYYTRHVLNAFRHQRSFHTIKRVGTWILGMCSTPFGIKDPFTIFLIENFYINIKCSTPFGIKDPFTQKRQIQLRSHPVLNAFRHQRSFHTSQYILTARHRCAQRLSASKILSLIPAHHSY